MNPYIGCESQLYGIEEHRLVGGKGDGMRLLQIRNGHGMELTVSLDRCCDISRLTYDGVNMGYFSPCGYVAPSYYQPTGTDWLKSFTAGFLTTCGLNAVGSPCVDDGEALPLHGSVVEVGTIAEIQFCRDFRNTFLGACKLLGCIFHSKTHAVIKKTLSGVFFDNPSKVRPIVIQDLRQFLVGDPAMSLIEELIDSGE